MTIDDDEAGEGTKKMSSPRRATRLTRLKLKSRCSNKSIFAAGMVLVETKLAAVQQSTDPKRASPEAEQLDRVY
jgi:hypothetical protein